MRPACAIDRRDTVESYPNIRRNGACRYPGGAGVDSATKAPGGSRNLSLGARSRRPYDRRDRSRDPANTGRTRVHLTGVLHMKTKTRNVRLVTAVAEVG